MIPFPLYFNAVQSNLELGFSDFRKAVAVYAGFGADSDDWTADQTVELGEDVNEAYRWILNPETIPGERSPHQWSWREQWTTLITASGTYEYTLPADFGSFVGKNMFWGASTGYTHPMKVNDGDILDRRSSGTTSGRPTCFALHWAAQTAGSRQRQVIWLHPIPDGEYTLNYKYAVLTTGLSESNPYPLGGPRIGQLVLEFSKAIGEAKRNGGRGDQWAMAMARLRAEIAMDAETLTQDTLGPMRGAPMSRYPIIPGSTTYSFGPDASYGATLYEAEVA